MIWLCDICGQKLIELNYKSRACMTHGTVKGRGYGKPDYVPPGTVREKFFQRRQAVQACLNDEWKTATEIVRELRELKACGYSYWANADIREVLKNLRLHGIAEMDKTEKGFAYRLLAQEESA